MNIPSGILRGRFLQACAGIAVALLIGSLLHAQLSVTTAPSDQTDSTAPATQPAAQISPDALQLLRQMRDAYTGLKSMQIAGKIDAQFDIDGEKRNENAQFSGLYDSRGLFRNEVKGDTLVGNTGSKVYIFLPAENRYTSSDAPEGAVNLDSIGDDAADVLRKQDLSLALALSGDASKELSEGATSITRAPDMTIDGAACPTILIHQNSMDVTLAMDSQTHLLKREVVDLTKGVKQQGARVIKAALLTVDFTSTPAEAADVKQFQWAPPPGTQELKAQGDSSALVGKPAPAFTLEDLNGRQVSSKSLKNTVYVLDFWATWCGPCVASLPELDRLYRGLKDSGLKVFALDQREEKDVVQKFITEKKMTLTPLLDSDGKVGNAYGVEGIPTTVVVGKDGRVRKVFVGSGNEEGIKEAVNAALKEK